MINKTNTKKKTKKKALGRGLESLLKVPLQEEERIVKKNVQLQSPRKDIQDTEIIHQVAIEYLKPNSEQPRKVFSEDALVELTNSIKISGIMQPIVAKRVGDNNFEIIAGERRWRSAQRAGLKKVPVILRKVDDKEKLELAIIENIQRDNLTPVEEGQAYELLANKYGLTQKEIAERVGKDRATVANLIRITGLDDRVKELINSGQLSLGHGKVLLSVQDRKLQHNVALRAMRLNLSVRATESLIKSSLAGTLEKDSQKKQNRAHLDLEDRLRKEFGTKVKVEEKEGKGKLVISFHSMSQMNSIIDKLMP